MRSDRDELDEFARGPFEAILVRFQELLLRESAQRVGERDINANDLEETYSYLVSKDPMALKEAQEIVSRAIRENRAGEWIAYGMALILFFAGLLLLFTGIYRESYPAVVGGVLGGTVAEGILPLRFAIEMRRHNIRLRLVGILLDRVKDPKALADLLKKTFPETVSADAGSFRPRERG